MATPDEERFARRATDGRMHVLAGRMHLGSHGPTGTDTPEREVPRRDVDGLAHVLHEEVGRLRKELADTKERLARVERLLAESWGKK